MYNNLPNQDIYNKYRTSVERLAKGLEEWGSDPELAKIRRECEVKHQGEYVIYSMQARYVDKEARDIFGYKNIIKHMNQWNTDKNTLLAFEEAGRPICEELIGDMRDNNLPNLSYHIDWIMRDTVKDMIANDLPHASNMTTCIRWLLNHEISKAKLDQFKKQILEAGSPEERMQEFAKNNMPPRNTARSWVFHENANYLRTITENMEEENPMLKLMDEAGTDYQVASAKANYLLSTNAKKASAWRCKNNFVKQEKDIFSLPGIVDYMDPDKITAEAIKVFIELDEPIMPQINNRRNYFFTPKEKLYHMWLMAEAGYYLDHPNEKQRLDREVACYIVAHYNQNIWVRLQESNLMKKKDSK